jgi:hypothetical protein
MPGHNPCCDEPLCCRGFSLGGYDVTIEIAGAICVDNDGFPGCLTALGGIDCCDTFNDTFVATLTPNAPAPLCDATYTWVCAGQGYGVVFELRKREDDHYWAKVTCSGLGADAYFEVDLGADKPNCEDIDGTDLPFADQEEPVGQDYCDFSAATCTVTITPA